LLRGASGLPDRDNRSWSQRQRRSIGCRCHHGSFIGPVGQGEQGSGRRLITGTRVTARPPRRVKLPTALIGRSVIPAVSVRYATH